MKKPKMLLYLCAGSLVTVLIWSFVGGYQTTPNKEIEPDPDVEISSPETVTEAVAESVDTKEIMIEEGIIENEVVALKESKPPVKEVPQVLAEEQDEIVHVIDKGDTLWAISRTYGVPVTAIQEANGIEDAGSLSIGQKLKIPGA
jgi:LysM repeat protein